jgi:hypothetical protein
MISFRYNVIGSQPTGEQERVYNTAAAEISSGKVTEPRRVLGAIKALYPGDDQFRGAFKEKVVRTTLSRNRRVVRYILCAVETRITGVELDFNSDTFNIEHILPEKPGAGWETFSEEELEALTFRLGNMTLLRTGENKDLGNAPYSQKRPRYAASTFAHTRKVAEENADWTPDRVAARQNWMATQAATIWRIDQLS